MPKPPCCVSKGRHRPYSLSPGVIQRWIKLKENQERSQWITSNTMSSSNLNNSYLIYLPLGDACSSFNLETTVCSHGFFMMEPNRWNPSTKTLERPLRLLSSDDSVTVQVSHQRSSQLTVLIFSSSPPSLEDQKFLEVQIFRMLRISHKDERSIRDFHKIHPEAKTKGFGRIFRSPTLFEDLVKIILLRNIRWARSLDMAKELCELQHELRHESCKKLTKDVGEKRKKAYCKMVSQGRKCGNFPSPKELAGVDKKTWGKCNLGYRAAEILQLSKKIESGTFKLEEFVEENIKDSESVYRKFMNLRGFGAFSSSYVLTCMGFYHKIPADTETERHIKEFHPGKKVGEIYNKFDPFQYLAYWYELWGFYEKQFGKLSELNPANYKTVTGSHYMSRKKVGGSLSSTHCQNQAQI